MEAWAEEKVTQTSTKGKGTGRGGLLRDMRGRQPCEGASSLHLAPKEYQEAPREQSASLWKAVLSNNHGSQKMG